MSVSSCTYGGATSGRQPCTPGGATSASEVRSTLHPFLCNIGPLDVAPPLVQHTLHLRGCNIEYPYLLTHSRHALTCKTDWLSTAALRRQPLTYRTTNATTDRARIGEAVDE